VGDFRFEPLGKSWLLGKLRQQLLDRFLPDRTVVIVLDRDAQKKGIETSKNAPQRCQMAALADLPDGCDDVGDCTSEDAWQRVTLALGQLLKKIGTDD